MKGGEEREGGKGVCERDEIREECEVKEVLVG